MAVTFQLTCALSTTILYNGYEPQQFFLKLILISKVKCFGLMNCKLFIFQLQYLVHTDQEPWFTCEKCGKRLKGRKGLAVITHFMGPT